MSGEEAWKGVAVYQGIAYLLSGSLAEFILDYRAYDPVFSASTSASSFREGVLTVTVDTFPKFLKSLNARVFPLHELAGFLDSGGAKEILAFIDCDSRRYIHAYYDLALEDYVPRGWRGELGDPSQGLMTWYSTKKSGHVGAGQ